MGTNRADAMKTLSDNLRRTGDSRTIEGGRSAGTGPMNQKVLSTTSGAPWAIAAQADRSTYRTHT